MASIPGLLLAPSGVPTLEDARSAADALLAEGVSEVWVYGSVARGESHPGSDIDLVAVFDDLDYRKRLGVTMRLQRAAEQACGHPVEMTATDRAEWRIQREDVTASFACAISCDLILLACSPDPPGAVDWNKEQVMATSNGELAVERLQAVLGNLDKIFASLAPARPEQALAGSDNRSRYERARAGRMIQICEAAQLAVENAAKAIAVLGGVPAKTLWTHDVKKLVDSLDDGVSEELHILLHSAPELVKHEGYITMWRTCGAYGTCGEGLTAQEIATPAFARAMALITCDITDYTVRAVRYYLGSQDTVTELDDWAQIIRQHLTSHDIITGEPTPPPEPGADHGSRPAQRA